MKDLTTSLRVPCETKCQRPAFTSRNTSFGLGQGLIHHPQFSIPPYRYRCIVPHQRATNPASKSVTPCMTNNPLHPFSCNGYDNEGEQSLLLSWQDARRLNITRTGKQQFIWFMVKSSDSSTTYAVLASPKPSNSDEPLNLLLIPMSISTKYRQHSLTRTMKTHTEEPR